MRLLISILIVGLSFSAHAEDKGHHECKHHKKGESCEHEMKSCEGKMTKDECKKHMKEHAPKGN